MGEFQAVSDVSSFTAILWIFYPMTILVGLELFLRALRDDDDDDDGGTGIRIQQEEMKPAYASAGA
tara:strand:- start:44 stop:241 length:198 start_codon:yes stop_codon:yes gene_type:complete